MSKKQEFSTVFKEEMNNMGLHFHEEIYDGIVDYLGPSIYDADASLVACSDPKELETIKTSFLIGKLGLEDSPRLDEAIKEICHALGESNNKKHRTTFYYLLTAIFNKEAVFHKD